MDNLTFSFVPVLVYITDCKHNAQHDYVECSYESCNKLYHYIRDV